MKKFTLLLLFLVCLFLVSIADVSIALQKEALSPNKLLLSTMQDDDKINDDTGTEDQINPALAMSKYGYPVVCWEDGRNGNKDIYVQQYTFKGLRFKTNYIVNDDEIHISIQNLSLADDLGI